MPTPNHPEYTAAHLCVAAAEMAVLERHFGTNRVRFRMDSRVPETTVHVYESTRQFLDEVADARVHGGMHFRTSVRDGAALGARVGEWVVERGFKAR